MKKYPLSHGARRVGSRILCVLQAVLASFCIGGIPAFATEIHLFSPTVSDCGWVAVSGVVLSSGGVAESLATTVDWGDGVVSSGTLPVAHQYRRNGDYTLRVNGTSPSGATASAVATASVTTAGTRDCNTDPGVLLLPRNPEMGDCGRVRIDGAAFLLPSGTPDLAWNWGDGTTDVGGFPRVHQFRRNGDFQVTVTAVSSSGPGLSRRIAVSVSNAGQGACRAGGSLTLLPGTPVYESCGAVMIPGTVSTTSGDVQEVRFDWGDGVVTRDSFPGFHRYATNGRRAVRVTAVNSFGDELSAVVAALVQNASEGACDDGPTLTLSPGTPVVGTCGEVDVPGTAAASAGTLMPLSWDWGDGTQSTGAFPGHHRYLRSGTFAVTVTAASSLGDRRSASLRVDVPAPDAGTCNAAAGLHLLPGAPAYGPCGAVSIPGEIQSGVGTVTNILWTWGDGTSGWSSFPAFHLYRAAGTYRVTAEAWTAAGDRTVATVVVSVEPFQACVDEPLLGLELAAPQVTAGGHVSLDGSVLARFGSVQELELAWGDDAVETGSLPASHVYGSDGLYVVTVRVTTTMGQSVLAYMTVVVTGTTPAMAAARAADATRPSPTLLGLGAALRSGLRVEASPDLRSWQPVLTTHDLPPVPGSGSLFLRIQPPATR